MENLLPEGDLQIQMGRFNWGRWWWFNCLNYSVCFCLIKLLVGSRAEGDNEKTTREEGREKEEKDERERDWRDRVPSAQ